MKHPDLNIKNIIVNLKQLIGNRTILWEKLYKKLSILKHLSELASLIQHKSYHEHTKPHWHSGIKLWDQEDRIWKDLK
jgi:hypothetical protein